MERVELGPFRAAFAARPELSVRGIAVSMGRDEAQVSRWLTSRVSVSTKRYGGREFRYVYRGARSIRYDNALELAEALGLDPVDVGL